MPEFEALAQNIKKKRKEMGETQLVFGMNCGVSTDEISHIETGKTNPKLKTIQNIAAYTGLTVSELLTKEGDEKK